MKKYPAVGLLLLCMLWVVLPLSGIKHDKSSKTGFISDVSYIKNTHSRIHKQIVGYYPNWLWYRRNHLVNPTTLDYGKYTVINYA